jgi:hypothetical protein
VKKELTLEQRRERFERSMRNLAAALERNGVASAEVARAMRDLATKFHVERVAHLIGDEHMADPEYQRRVLAARAADPETGLAGHMLEVAAAMWPDD